MAAAKTKKRTTRKPAGPKVDAYQLVTDKIIEALEAGHVPWHKPWRSVTNAPRSLTTRKPYQGINVFLLGATSMAMGYSSRWWGTYKQIAERGGQVRKGEKGTTIVFWRFIGEEKDGAGNVTKRGIPMLRTFTVFNADQADDLKMPDEEPLAEHVPIDECERISNGYLAHGGPQLGHGGDRACYSVLLDKVQMPKLGQFKTPEHYYGTLFHEYAHSTGAQSRLNRTSLTESNVFGDEDYSREELVAEMTAAFVCGEAGIEVNVPHHAGYIASWVSALKNDDNKKLVVEAGGAAQRAANLILGRNPAAEATTDEEGGQA